MQKKLLELIGYKNEFFKFIVQQYENYKIEKVTLLTRCDTCPCKTLRDGMFGTHRLRKECLQEMIYLLNKFNIHCYVTSCNDLRDISLIIAKKMSERNNRI